MFIENVKNTQNEWWRYLLVGPLIIVVFWQFLGAIPLLIGLFSVADLDKLQTLNESNFLSAFPNYNIGLALFCITFLVGLIGIFFTVKVVHKQTIKSLTTSRDKVDFKRIFNGFFVISTVNAIGILVAYLYDPSVYEFNFKPQSFVYLSLIAIFLLPFQTSFEEYLVRGYLLQGIGITTKSRLLALLIPTLLFALLHLANPEIDKMGYGFLGAYFIMGLVWGICTLMDDGLELALGMHFGNNFIGILLMTADWTVLQTDSVLKYVGEPNMSIMFLTSIPLQILILLYFSKKYNWTNWREKLLGSLN